MKTIWIDVISTTSAACLPAVLRHRSSSPSSISSVLNWAPKHASAFRLVRNWEPQNCIRSFLKALPACKKLSAVHKANTLRITGIRTSDLQFPEKALWFQANARDSSHNHYQLRSWKAVKPPWIPSLQVTQSLDSFMGNVHRKQIFYHQIWVFPNCPINQFLDSELTWDSRPRRAEAKDARPARKLITSLSSILPTVYLKKKYTSYNLKQLEKKKRYVLNCVDSWCCK